MGQNPPQVIELNGVGDGIRTRDFRNHNPTLYQLSYTHRVESSV
jgi:hypothetical protein